jgi:hypothetical protein
MFPRVTVNSSFLYLEAERFHARIQPDGKATFKRPLGPFRWTQFEHTLHPIELDFIPPGFAIIHAGTRNELRFVVSRHPLTQQYLIEFEQWGDIYVYLISP